MERIKLKLLLYIGSPRGSLCFPCAVKEIIKGTKDKLEFSIEEGHHEGWSRATGYPRCYKCKTILEEYPIDYPIIKEGKEK